MQELNHPRGRHSRQKGALMSQPSQRKSPWRRVCSCQGLGLAGPSFRLTRGSQQQENKQTGAAFGCADGPPRETGAGRGCVPIALCALEFLFGQRRRPASKLVFASKEITMAPSGSKQSAFGPRVF